MNSVRRRIGRADVRRRDEPEGDETRRRNRLPERESVRDAARDRRVGHRHALEPYRRGGERGRIANHEHGFRRRRVPVRDAVAEGRVPGGGVGRHTAHDAAPDAAPETPSRKTPCAEEEEEEEEEEDEEDQTGAKTPHGRAGKEATAAASLCDTRVSVAIFEGDSARRNGPLTTVTRASTPSLRAPVAASVCEIIRNVRSTGNSTSSPAARSIQRRAPASHSGRLTPTRSSCTCTSVSTTPSSSSSSSSSRVIVFPTASHDDPRCLVVNGGCDAKVEVDRVAFVPAGLPD